MVTTDQIKELRDATGVSVMQCKKALEEAGGNQEKALAILRKKSRDIAAKKSDRSLGASVIASYVHSNGLVGAMVEIASETDFVAKHEDFKKLAYDLAMHVAAANPEFLRKEDISREALDMAKSLFEKEAKEQGKGNVSIEDKILIGKLDAYFAERILLIQPFVKQGDISVSELINQATQKFGEKIEIVRFVRFAA